MTDFANMSCVEYASELASKKPVPGGGGASAYVGALGISLGCMCAALTVGKKKYAEVQDEIRIAINEADGLRERLMDLSDEDARAFEPLSRAYAMPAETDDERVAKNEEMERCLRGACEIPLEIMRACCEAIALLSKIEKMGAETAISDVGCGAACCKAALRAASLNVFVNTRLMHDESYARDCNTEAQRMLDEYAPMAESIFWKVEERLKP